MKIVPVNNTIMNSVTYVLYSEEVDYCILIDCGEYETLKPVLNSIGKQVYTVLLTHGHSDHIYGLNKLLKDNPDIIIGTNSDGHVEIQDARKNLSFYHNSPFTLEHYHPLELKDKQILNFEGLARIEVMATPGHDTSCLTYKIDNNLFTGDAYIPGVKVITTFPRGNKELAKKTATLLSEMERHGYKVYSGHHTK